ncbi:MAG TPA: hypothetical protein V6C97_17825 [Oculatellaceae cyanobacterium]
MNGTPANFKCLQSGTTNRIEVSRISCWRKFFIASTVVLAVTATSATSVPAAISADFQQNYQASEDLPIPSAVQVAVIFKQELDSAKLANDDQIEVELKEDLTLNDELIAPAGSIIIGHIEELQQSRRLAESTLSSKRRFHKGSSLKIAFDEIITPEDNHIPVVGCLSHQSQSFTEDGRPRQVEISKRGELIKAEESFSTEEKVTSQIVNYAAGTGLNALGTVASFGASAVVMGVLGAYDPALVAPRPLRKDEKHPRVKGFAFGVFESLPGAPVMSAMIFKGADIHIQPGDEYLAQIHSPYPETVPVLSLSSKVVRISPTKPAVPVKSPAVPTVNAPAAAPATTLAPGAVPLQVPAASAQAPTQTQTQAQTQTSTSTTSSSPSQGTVAKPSITKPTATAATQSSVPK